MSTRVDVLIEPAGTHYLQRTIDERLATHERDGHTIVSVQLLGPYHSQSFHGHAQTHTDTYTIIIVYSCEE